MQQRRERATRCLCVVDTLLFPMNQAGNQAYCRTGVCKWGLLGNRPLTAWLTSCWNTRQRSAEWLYVCRTNAMFILQCYSMHFILEDRICRYTRYLALLWNIIQLEITKRVKVKLLCFTLQCKTESAPRTVLQMNISCVIFMWNELEGHECG